MGSCFPGPTKHSNNDTTGQKRVQQRVSLQQERVPLVYFSPFLTRGVSHNEPTVAAVAKAQINFLRQRPLRAPVIAIEMGIQRVQRANLVGNAEKK